MENETQYKCIKPIGQESLRDLQWIAEAVQEFAKIMNEALKKFVVAGISEEDIDFILDALREKELWGPKNDATLNRMAAGIGRGAALGVLIQGNAKTSAIIQETLAEKTKMKFDSKQEDRKNKKALRAERIHRNENRVSEKKKHKE